jgi:TPR repeat protein
MPRAKRLSWMARQIEANELYQRADEHWSRGRLRPAFRLFLAAAKAGIEDALGIVGYFYDDGVGVKADQDAALYWYRRAYRHGSDSAANNIGCIWRDRKKFSRALMWFKRAVRLGDGDANLNIAMIYLYHKPDLKKAIRYLHNTLKLRNVTDGGKEEARSLLKQVRKSRARHDRESAGGAARA